MKYIAILLAVSIIGLAFILSYGIVFSGLSYILPPPYVRRIAQYYLKYSFNMESESYNAISPEVVTAIIWDFRGLDTLFEIAVFFFAIIGATALQRGLKVIRKLHPTFKIKGLSPIVKTVTRIITSLIIVVGSAIVIHGHLTPGGGFQGGAVLSMIPLLLLIVFSVQTFSKIGVHTKIVIVLRTLGLLGIITVVLLPVIISLNKGAWGFVFQNQPKLIKPYETYVTLIDVPSGGSILILNILDGVAIASGFTLLLIFLTVSEKHARKVIDYELRVHRH